MTAQCSGVKPLVVRALTQLRAGTAIAGGKKRQNKTAGIYIYIKR
jgi:hypothetical protein